MTDQRPRKEFDNSLKIELNFYELLRNACKQKVVEILIPETFIYGYGFSKPTLLCSDYLTGVLQCKENISKIGVLESCFFFEKKRPSKGNYPLMIAKTSDSYGRDTCRALFTAQESINVWNRNVRTCQQIVMQRYIPANSMYLSLIKTSWRFLHTRIRMCTVNKPIKLSELDIISSSYSDLRKSQPSKQNEKCRDSADFLITQADPYALQEINQTDYSGSTLELLKNLVEEYYKATVIYIEADFIQDKRGLQYLINLKNFKLARFGYVGPVNTTSNQAIIRMNSSYKVALPSISASKLNSSFSKPRLSRSVTKPAFYREKPISKPKTWEKVLSKRRGLNISQKSESKERLNYSIT